MRARCTLSVVPAAVVALLTGVVVRAAPAGATQLFNGSAVVGDPRGDTQHGPNPQGDITSASVSDDGTQIRLSVTTAAFESPATSRAWRP